ncbi:cytidine deaminase [Pedobacter yulinensis]|uniref:Cytidine deaminase n=1 Tax=Pedobacter yulinensis TaxID=2126353 RepID=A0A2T3HQ06_9SPHI|nr:cytidine deaminase [Pedobacter yulinensis]PST84473.1 cytidine deaminase [Pedobacter yulinensis]
MEKISLQINYTRHTDVSELDQQERRLCEAAVAATESSYSPYSGFRVGAALQLETGEIVPGSNQENMAYPSGLCAERTALFAAGAQFPGRAVTTMAVTAKTDRFLIRQPVTSCGACLQVMAEFEKRQGSPIAVIFYCIGGEVIRLRSVRDLLPFAFNGEGLKG